MEILPDEVLLLIFERLPSRSLATVGQVCRRWRALVLQRAIEVQCQDDVTQLHGGIIALRISGFLDSLRACIITAIDVAPYLRQLTVRATNCFNDENIAALSSLRYLDHLDIFIQTRRVDTRLLPVFMRLSSLVINETVTQGVLRVLATSDKLRHLYMYGRSMYFPTHELLGVLRARKLHLRELTLRCTELMDVAYEAVGQCSNLTSLQLYSCWLMTGDGAMHITRLKNLRLLHLTGARMVRSRAFTLFIERLPVKLEELCLTATWFEDTHTAALAKRLPGLKVLELWRCRLTSASIMNMVNAMPALHTIDLDIPLTDVELLQLSNRPLIASVRCLPETRHSNLIDDINATDTYNIMKDGKPKTRVYAADAKFASKYMRGGGDGYRGALFYYCTQDVELQPLPSKLPPGFDLDDDDYY